MKLTTDLIESGNSGLIIKQICCQNGLQIDNSQCEKLSQYIDLLLSWNDRINLVSRSADRIMITAHVIHCLSLLFKVEIPAKLRILDLGTGGGLPGIPLSIARPDLSLTLIDSIRKKTTAVESIATQLGLSCRVINSRAEGLSHTHPGFFDIVLCRAVASLSDLIKWSKPILTSRKDQGRTTGERMTILPGSLVAFKGGDLDQEIEQAKIKTGDHLIQTHPLSFKGADELNLVDKKIIVARIGR